MVLVPVTDAVADLLGMADPVDVIDVPVVLEIRGLLDADGLPVGVFDGFMVAESVDDALLVFDDFIE